MESEKCRVLLCAIDKGSITAAAEAMGYTISGVSRMMTALEAEVGFPLLRRSREGVIPTNECCRLLPSFREMVAQVGAPQWEGEKLKSGVVIRHLILPGQVENSLKALDWIGEHFRPGEVLVSLMRQYTPMGGLPAPYDRRITDEEYDAVLSWMYLNDLEGFTQEAEAADKVFIPDF